MIETLEAVLKEGTKILEASGNGEAGLDAWLLFEYVFERNRAYFFAHGEETAEETKMEQYLELCKKRAAHIPLQHLTHQGFFMGYEFYVNEHVLIPRQDTETLVEEAEVRLKNMEAPRILDMCTGSGCILLSILADLETATGVGADISKEALKVAKRNAKLLLVDERAELVESNLFSNEIFYEKDGKIPGKYDMLISNPPYIRTAEIEGLMEEVRLHDPREALDGFEDGLYFYREITKQASSYLKKGGWLLYEIGYDQGIAVSKLLCDAGFEEVKIVKDLVGLDRVVLGHLPF